MPHLSILLITIYINDYQAIKQGTAIINIAKLTNYEEQYTKVDTGEVDEDGNKIYKEELVPAKDVHLIVRVDGTQVESTTVKQNEDAFSVRVEGTGTVTIEVVIDGSRKAKRDLNLNASTSITID